MDIKNHVQLIGNLGSDPIIRELENGRKMARISVATTEYYNDDKGEFKKVTSWHNVVAWGYAANTISKKCIKGTEVIIAGKLTNRSFLDSNGEKKYVTEVVVKNIICRPAVAIVNEENV